MGSEESRRTFMKSTTTVSVLTFVLTLFMPGLVQSQTPNTAAKNEKFVSAVISKRPEPKPPENYPGPKINPTVVLRVVFTSWGEVTNIKLVKVTPEEISKDLSKDLVKRCKKAAKQIKFIPATRDGRSVSMLMELEYTFDLDKYSPHAP
jgi:hypothetical protein